MNRNIFTKKILSFLTIGILVSLVMLSCNACGKKNPPALENTEPDDTASQTESAVVSTGVKTSDLGNIMNGQYYFSTDQYVFYSSFDTNNKAHIYSVKKDGTELKPIFDGFGWSLVVIEDWLYFSGNQGAEIDGTYNIFRMKLDGSQLEKINDQYSYGMFFYDNYLYYMKSNDEHQSSMSICRSSIDGSSEEVLFPLGYSPVIHKNQLYYFDNIGNMFRTKPDGTEPQVLLTAAVKSYVLSEDKIVYFDHNSDIYICDLDGENNKLIRSAKNAPINNINAYEGRIFFSEYDTNFNYSAYGYDYTINSCKMDGSDEKEVFSSVSYGIYMNLVNDKLMLMDYALNPSSSVMNAVIKIMNLEGGNVNTLAR